MQCTRWVVGCACCLAHGVPCLHPLRLWRLLSSAWFVLPALLVILAVGMRCRRWAQGLGILLLPALFSIWCPLSALACNALLGKGYPLGTGLPAASGNQVSPPPTNGNAPLYHRVLVMPVGKMCSAQAHPWVQPNHGCFRWAAKAPFVHCTKKHGHTCRHQHPYMHTLPRTSVLSHACTGLGA